LGRRTPIALTRLRASGVFWFIEAERKAQEQLARKSVPPNTHHLHKSQTPTYLEEAFVKMS
jgi:hypothetical protein